MVEMLDDVETCWNEVSKAQVVRMGRGVVCGCKEGIRN